MTAALIRLFKAEIIKFNKKGESDGEGSPPLPAQLGNPAPREELPKLLADAEWEKHRAIYQLTALPYL